MTPEQLAAQLSGQFWPVVYSAGFAGLVALILLWILHKTLDAHTRTQIENSAKLNEVAEDLKHVVEALRSLEKYIERRRQT